jgi:hypothetical protein
MPSQPMTSQGDGSSSSSDDEGGSNDFRVLENGALGCDVDNSEDFQLSGIYSVEFAVGDGDEGDESGSVSSRFIDDEDIENGKSNSTKEKDSTNIISQLRSLRFCIFALLLVVGVVFATLTAVVLKSKESQAYQRNVRSF